MHCLSDTRIARAYLRPLLANTCTDHGRVLPWEANSDSITKMLSVVHEANQNEFSAALAFKLSLLKTHILSPDSHGRSRVKLSLSSDIVGIRKHIHSQLRQVPSPYSVLLELFCQVTNPVGYHMPIMQYAAFQQELWALQRGFSNWTTSRPINNGAKSELDDNEMKIEAMQSGVTERMIGTREWRGRREFSRERWKLCR